MAAIILKDRDCDRDRGLISERIVSLAGNGGRRDAVCAYSNRLIVMVSVPALVSVVCVAGGSFYPLHSCPYIAIISSSLNV